MNGARRTLGERTREVQETALSMRKEPTPAEAALWDSLRDRGLAGMKFRRQHALGRFVLDFYCAGAKLCIELDGSVHDEDAQRERDEIRSDALAALGIRVVRFRNADVLTNLPAVLQRIVDSARK